MCAGEASRARLRSVRTGPRLLSEPRPCRLAQVGAPKRALPAAPSEPEDQTPAAGRAHRQQRGNRPNLRSPSRCWLLQALVPEPADKAVRHRGADDAARLAPGLEALGEGTPARVVVNQAPGRFDEHAPQLRVGGAD